MTSRRGFRTAPNPDTLVRSRRCPADVTAWRRSRRRLTSDAATRVSALGRFATAAGALPLTVRPVSAAAAADKTKIGFLLKTMQEERYQADKALFIARAE